MKQLISTLLMLCVTLGLHGQSLDDYLEAAASNNPSLKAVYYEFEASLKRIPQVRALEDPRLSFGYFISPIETRVGAQQARFSLSQMFPWFGTLKAKEEAARLHSESKYQDFLKAKNELFLKVKLAYFPIDELKEHIRLEKQNLEILKAYKQLATTSFASGIGSLSDVLRVEIMIEDVKSDIQLLRDQIKPQTIQFNRLLNRADSIEVIISDSLTIDKSLNYAEADSVFKNNPQILKLEKRLSALKAEELVAQKNGLPQIGVGLDYALISERTDLAAGVNIPDNGRNALMPMVTMSLPVFRKKYQAAAAQNQLMQKSIEYNMKGVENDLMSHYVRNLYELDKAISLDQLYRQQMKKTEQVINLLYTYYSNSGKDFDEVLKMQQQLLKYKMAQASAKVRLKIAVANLEYIIGK